MHKLQKHFFLILPKDEAQVEALAFKTFCKKCMYHTTCTFWQHVGKQVANT